VLSLGQDPRWRRFLYVQAVLPIAGRLLRNGWREVGDFLGGSIRDFWWRHPLERQLEWWHTVGLRGVEGCDAGDCAGVPSLPGTRWGAAAGGTM
jgi:hypothetical protein